MKRLILLALTLAACGPPSPASSSHGGNGGPAGGGGSGGGSGPSGYGPCAIRTDTTCAGDGACTFFVPGCGQPTLPVAGCFPAHADCRDTGCEPPYTCRAVFYNPCGEHECAVDCGEQAWLCLP